MIAITVIAGFFAIASAAQLAQAPTEANHTGEVKGTVVDASSNNPIHKALVTLRKGEEPGIGTYTDAAGKFTFTLVDPGTYVIAAEREGFVANSKSQPQTVSISAGEAGFAIPLKLYRTGAISGHVTDADGESIMGASVQVVLLNPKKNQQPSAVTYGMTDDRGDYRAYNIPPGRYRLAVTYSPRRGQPAVKMQNASEKGKDIGAQAYGETFYPGTLDPSQASTIQVDPGADLQGVDIGLLRIKTVRVKGRVVDADGGASTPLVAIFLSRLAGGDPLDTQLRPDGSFEFDGVAPGEYSLAAIGVLQHGSQLSATQQLEVGQTDIDGVQLTLGRAQTVTGSVVLPEDRKLPPGLAVILRSRSHSQQFGIQNGGFAQLNEKGNFFIENVAPGDYDLVVANTGKGDDLFVAAMRSANQDILPSGLHIGSGPPPPIEIVLQANGAAIDCTVIDEKQKPVPDGFLMLLPDPPRRSQLALHAECQADASGKCTLLGVAPGDYHAFAFRKDDVTDVSNPESMSNIEQFGAAVSVSLNEKKSVQVQIVRTDDQDN